MKTIYKYSFDIEDEITMMLPSGARVLSVQTQYEVPCMWVVLDIEKPLVARRFLLRGTGHALDGADPDQYIGTFQMRGGSLVFHLFEAGRVTK